MWSSEIPVPVIISFILLAPGVLAICLLDLMSLIVVPVLWGNVYSSCNAVAQANVTKIIHTNTILCDIDFQVNDTTNTEWNVQLHNIQCSLFADCITTTTPCTAMVTYNQIYKGDSSCLDIVTSNLNMPHFNYERNVAILHIFYACWIITVVVGVAFAAAERFKPRMITTNKVI